MSYPDTERFFYNNEIFALSGLVVLLAILLKGRIKRDIIFLFFFVFYGFLWVLWSIPTIIETGMYLSMRTMVVWYSTFAFFLGMTIAQSKSLMAWGRLARGYRTVSWITLFVSWARLSPQVLIMYGVKNRLSTFGFLAFAILAFYVAKPGSTTITAFLVLISFWVWINSKTISAFFGKKMIILFTVVALGLLYYMLPILDSFLSVGYSGFSGDNNATWRLMFWLYLFKEQFLTNPFFGLGFGTKLFDLETVPAFITSDDGSRFTEYTLGTHNSFFYILIRLGSVGFTLLILSIMQIFSVSVRALRSKNNGHQLLFGAMLAGLMFVNSALFNVVLESPLYASNFWFTMGVIYGLSRKVLERGA